MQEEQSSLHYAFIFNPRAGRYRRVELMRRIGQIFSGGSHGHTAEVFLTDRSGHASELAADLARLHRGRLVAVACGGDGTANEVANGIAGTQAAMTILPIGTANDFARAALSDNIPSRLLDKIIRPSIRPIDVIRVDERICLNIASLGFDTKVQMITMAINARFRWLGSFTYPLAILLSLLGDREYTMHYNLDTINEQGEITELEGDAAFILAAICNGRFYGNGFNPAPAARLDDGRLDFCLVDAMPLLRMLPLIPKYKKGRHLSDPAVHAWQVTGGRIRAIDGLLLGNLDGETFSRSSIGFKIIPKGMNFAFY